MTVTDVKITDAELGLALRKGISLDKYVEARRRLGLNPTRARAVASLQRLQIEHYQEALTVGLRHGQIVRLARGKFSLRPIIDLMRSGATLEEAYEVCESSAPITGSYSYCSLRSREFGLSHREIIRLVDVANSKQGVIAQRFLELVVGVKTDETLALEVAQTDLTPMYYLIATTRFDMTHEEIMDRCKTYQDTQEFERELHDVGIAEHRAAMAALRASKNTV
jgi:hypothetical protein